MNNLPKFHNSREYADRMKPLTDKRFANSWFKTGPLHSKEFNISHSGLINCMELSHDRTFFITGVRYQNKENVLKLSMGYVFGTTQTELMPTVIHNTVECFITCLAISPDDRRIFSGSWSENVLVCDIQRGQVLHSIAKGGANEVGGISVQPSSHKGDVFAVGTSDEDVLRIFDVRSSTTVPVMEKAGRVNHISSVEFSSVRSNHVAIGGWEGGKIIDIRRPDDDLLLLSDRFCDRIRYDSKGDRIILMEAAGPQVIDLSVFTGGSELEGKKKLTSTVEKDHYWAINGACCFAGANDELVVSASNWGDLHVWSIPQGHLNSSADNQQIMFLPFDDANSVFYSKERSALISCYTRNQIKVWTSYKLPQVPMTENGM